MEAPARRPHPAGILRKGRPPPEPACPRAPPLQTEGKKDLEITQDELLSLDTPHRSPSPNLHPKPERDLEFSGSELGVRRIQPFVRQRCFSSSSATVPTPWEAPWHPLAPPGTVSQPPGWCWGQQDGAHAASSADGSITFHLHRSVPLQGNKSNAWDTKQPDPGPVPRDKTRPDPSGEGQNTPCSIPTAQGVNPS